MMNLSSIVIDIHLSQRKNCVTAYSFVSPLFLSFVIWFTIFLSHFSIVVSNGMHEFTTFSATLTKSTSYLATSNNRFSTFEFPELTLAYPITAPAMVLIYFA